MQYSQVTTADWATHKYIEYTYDENGSCVSKTTKDSESTTVESVTYDYNLQNRLATVATDSDPCSSSNAVDYAEYAYNDDGIRVSCYTYTSTDGGTNRSNEKTVLYLIDSSNHTGYAQVITELTYNKAAPDSGTD